MIPWEEYFLKKKKFQPLSRANSNGVWANSNYHFRHILLNVSKILSIINLLIRMHNCVTNKIIYTQKENMTPFKRFTKQKLNI